MEISVVLITCDRDRALREAVRSLLAQHVDTRWAYELVVVDDGSSDGTAQVLEELRQRAPVPFHVVRTNGIGVPAARNLGARCATGRWMACFDDDQVASPGLLQVLRQTAEETGSRCIGGALTLHIPVSATADFPEFAPRARRLLGEHVLCSRACRYPRKWVPASNNVLIERDLFFAVGGFDETFRQGGSDTDLFERVRRAGEALWFAPEAHARHMLPPERLRAAYLRWTGRKVGAATARILRTRGTLLQRLSAASVRCGLAAVRDVPALCWCTVAGKEVAALEFRCSLWYTEGLLRGLASGLAPRALGEPRFLHALDFRAHGGERSRLVSAPAPHGLRSSL